MLNCCLIYADFIRVFEFEDYMFIYISLLLPFFVQVIATETESVVPLSAQIEVIVEIIDVNDHFPQFEQDTYTAHVREDALPGTHVITVTVSDFTRNSFE